MPALTAAGGPRGEAVFSEAIPCLSVADVQSSVLFYTLVLTFSRAGPRDDSRAMLFRGQPRVDAGASGRPARSAPPAGVRVILRAAERVYPSCVFVRVRYVDAVFEEIVRRLHGALVVREGYFPPHYFAQARVHTRPQNTAWRTREFTVEDADANVMTFFEDIGV